MADYFDFIKKQTNNTSGNGKDPSIRQPADFGMTNVNDNNKSKIQMSNDKSNPNVQNPKTSPPIDQVTKPPTNQVANNLV